MSFSEVRTAAGICTGILPEMPDSFDANVPKVDCPACQQLLEEMNAACVKVHRFIILRWHGRAVDEDYLHELGDLIQVQAKAHRELVAHQETHLAAA